MTFPYQESYIERLQRHRLEVDEKRRTEPKPLTLAERIDTWWQGLPAAEQKGAWKMEFFVNYFGEAPASIGPSLFSLGFVRRRDWRIGKPHGRVWVKTNHV